MSNNTKKISIEKILYPGTGKLKEKKGELYSSIIDLELDEFELRFLGDECVEIITEGYEYIHLSVNKIYQIIKLIKMADKKYATFVQKKEKGTKNPPSKLTHNLN